MKNNMYNGTIRAIVKGSVASLAIAGLINISSCKKDKAKVTLGVAEASTTPITYGKYPYFSNTNKRVGIMVEDADGNWVTIESIRNKKGNQTLSTCLENSLDWDLVYRGYTIDDPCFGSPDALSELSHSWDLYLPEDINIVNNATCIAKIKLGSIGFITAPTGTGYRTTPYQYYYVETVNVGNGIMMKKWRIVANGTPISVSDYCANHTLIPTFKLKTDCDDLLTISPASTTDYMDNNSFTIPQLILSNGSVNGERKIEFVPQLNLCSDGCHGYWKWCTNYQTQYKLTTSSTWTDGAPQNSNDVIAFKIPVFSGSGTYLVRYKGLIRDITTTTTDVVWSDWVQPASTVYIP